MNRLIITFYIFVLIFIIAVFVLTQSDFFTKKVCGDPTPQQKEVVQKLNNEYKGIVMINTVPCYNEYLEVRIEKDSIPNSLINTINTRINGEYKALGWNIITVADDKGNFLFEQTYKDGNFKKSYENSQ